MTRILSHRQALWTIGLLAGAYIVIYLLATYWPGGHTSTSSTGWFSLTPAEAFSIVLRPGIVALDFLLTPAGILLLALSATKHNLRDYGLLTFFLGGICAILAMLV